MNAQPLEDPPAGAPESAALVVRVREVHTKMVEAVLAGDGLQRVAALAAEAVGGPVAVIVPRLGSIVSAPEDAIAADDLAALRGYVADRVRDRPSKVPDSLLAETPITSGDELQGAVVLAARPGENDAAPNPHAHEFLHIAAVAAMTEIAIEETREEVEQNLRGSFLEELLDRPEIEPKEIVRRAGRLGCDLARGAVALCAELTTDRPRHVVATIVGEHPGALAEAIEDRVYAVLPAHGGDDAPEATLTGARRLAQRLQRHGTVGISTFCSDPAGLPRAMQEAELVLEVLRHSDAPIAEDIGAGTYRLLFRVFASHPEEVRSFYDDTVAPLVRYDDQYATDLVGTLDAYLQNNCNMNATAAAIYAHRHTVAYRLDRVRELTGLDPMLSEDRERLGLGLKAYRIVAPRLPK